MPRPRSPERDKAFEIFLQHNGKIENRRIAELLGKDERLIADWKSKDKWVKKKNEIQQIKTVQQMDENCTVNTVNKAPSNIISENDTKETAALPPQNEKSKTNSTYRPKGGAPYGNKNAKGNRGGPGGPYGNKKAVTTGEHETITLSGITDEEELAILNASIEKHTVQELQIKKGLILEHRMMKRLTTADNAPGGMVIDSVIKNKGALTISKNVRSDDGELLPSGKATIEADDTTQTIAESSEKRSIKITEALARVMAGTQRGITQLHKMEIDDARSISESDELVDDWIAGVADE